MSSEQQQPGAGWLEAEEVEAAVVRPALPRREGDDPYDACGPRPRLLMAGTVLVLVSVESWREGFANSLLSDGPDSVLGDVSRCGLVAEVETQATGAGAPRCRGPSPGGAWSLGGHLPAAVPRPRQVPAKLTEREKSLFLPRYRGSLPGSASRGRCSCYCYCYSYHYCYHCYYYDYYCYYYCYSYHYCYHCYCYYYYYHHYCYHCCHYYYYCYYYCYYYYCYHYRYQGEGGGEKGGGVE
jgi:hypothetical protein